ncbi:MAG: hypothetical protein KC731_10705 [Myxococcales bacterium]|nr:hypothetical protein [Myxococcales bacterium]
MKLLRLYLESCRNLPDGDYLFTRRDGVPFDRIVITGPTASGKTTLLEVIAMVKENTAGYGGGVEPRSFLRDGESGGLARLTLLLDPAEMQRAETREAVVTLEVRLSGGLGPAPPRGVRELLRRYRHGEEHPKLDYLPATRCLPIDQIDLPPPSLLDEGRLRLSKAPRKYEGVVPWMRQLLLEEATDAARRLGSEGLLLAPVTAEGPLARLRQKIADLCPSLRLVDLADDRRTPRFERRDGTHRPLDQLSDAERDAILLAANAVRIGLRRSVVLLDRPELHAHDADVTRWLDVLGADNQLIVATTSPTVRRSVSEAQAIDLG